MSCLVVRSSWVLLHMTAVSCSDFLQRLFMNKTQHHFIHYKLAGCFAIIIQQFKAIYWVICILHYILNLAFYGALVLFQICYFLSFFIRLSNCLKFVPTKLLPWHHLPGYAGFAGNCKLFALVARDLEAHFTFGTRKRRLSTSQSCDQPGGEVGVRWWPFLIGCSAANLICLPIFDWKTHLWIAESRGLFSIQSSWS